MIEFDGPERDNDAFQITIPAGYVVDELPASVNLDLGSVAYHSKVEFSGQVLRYTRTFEIKDLSIPVDKLEQVQRFFNSIVADERSTAVFKRSSP
jgi:hypothetical protein